MQRVSDFELACQYVRDEKAAELRDLLGIPDYTYRIVSLCSSTGDETNFFDRSIDHLLCNGENLFTYFARSNDYQAVYFLFYTLKPAFYESKSEYEVVIRYLRSILDGHLLNPEKTKTMPFPSLNQDANLLRQLITAHVKRPTFRGYGVDPALFKIISERRLEELKITLESNPHRAKEIFTLCLNCRWDCALHWILDEFDLNLDKKRKYLVMLLRTYVANGLTGKVNKFITQHRCLLSDWIGINYILANDLVKNGFMNLSALTNLVVIQPEDLRLPFNENSIEQMTAIFACNPPTFISAESQAAMHPFFHPTVQLGAKMRDLMQRFHAPYDVVLATINGINPQVTHISSQYATRCTRLNINCAQALALTQELVILLLQSGTALNCDTMCIIASHYSSLSLIDTLDLSSKLKCQRTSKTGLFASRAQVSTATIFNSCNIM